MVNEEREKLLAGYLRQMAITFFRVRNRKGLKQSDLASLAGVTQGVISNIESGRSNITVLSLLKVSTALGVPVAEIFRDSWSLIETFKADQDLAVKVGQGRMSWREMQMGYEEVQVIEVAKDQQLFIKTSAGEVYVQKDGDTHWLKTGQSAVVPGGAEIRFVCAHREGARFAVLECAKGEGRW